MVYVHVPVTSRCRLCRLTACVSVPATASLSVCLLLVYRAWWTMVWAVRPIASNNTHSEQAPALHACVCLCVCEIACIYEQHTYPYNRSDATSFAFLAVVLKSPSFHIGWEILFQQVAASAGIWATTPTDPLTPPDPPPYPPTAWSLMLCSKSNQRINQLVAFHTKWLIWISSMLLPFGKRFMLVFYMFWWEFIDYIEVYSHNMLIFAAKQSDESVKSVRIVWHFYEIR